jgi:hypothetical protein
MVTKFYPGQRIRAVRNGGECYSIGEEFTVLQGRDHPTVIHCHYPQQPHVLTDYQCEDWVDIS